MSAPAHTPGPWHLDCLAANGEQEIGISRSAQDGGNSICLVESSRIASTLRADAHLIAAAPELLEEAKMNLAILLDLRDHPLLAGCAAVTRAVIQKRIEATEAAIAKAEGRKA